VLQGSDPRGAQTDEATALAHQGRKRPWLDIVIGWEPDGPLMVKAGYDGIAADMLPLVSGLTGGIAPVLPGSSIKGAFRTRAEQIVCTLLDIKPSDAKGERRKFLDDTVVPMVDELFGARGGIKPTAGGSTKVRGQYSHN